MPTLDLADMLALMKQLQQRIAALEMAFSERPDLILQVRKINRQLDDAMFAVKWLRLLHSL